MSGKRLSVMFVVAGVLLAAVAGSDAAEVFKSTVTGTPEVKTIDSISFGPEGLLLVGDGRGRQILAVDTGDTKPQGTMQEKIENISEKLAGRLGTTAKGIEILDLAVNPASGTAYISVRKQDDKSYAILTVDGDGRIGNFALEDVKYARLALPEGGKAPIGVIKDVAWAGDRVIAGAQANDAFRARIFSVRTPLSHDAVGDVYSAETFHVAHGRWETKAPMHVVLPYVKDDKTYVVGAFSCTPVVKYAIDDLEPGAQIKGMSVLELGSGNQPLDMFTYEKDGKSYVLSNTHRFHHKKRPFGPSPYWTVRFEADILGASEEINEKALRRLKGYEPATERVKMIEAFHGVTQMDRLDAKRALVLRTDGKNKLDLEPIALP